MNHVPVVTVLQAQHQDVWELHYMDPPAYASCGECAVTLAVEESERAIQGSIFEPSGSSTARTVPGASRRSTSGPRSRNRSSLFFLSLAGFGKLGGWGRHAGSDACRPDTTCSGEVGDAPQSVWFGHLSSGLGQTLHQSVIEEKRTWDLEVPQVTAQVNRWEGWTRQRALV